MDSILRNSPKTSSETRIAPESRIEEEIEPTIDSGNEESDRTLAGDGVDITAGGWSKLSFGLDANSSGLLWGPGE